MVINMSLSTNNSYMQGRTRVSVAATRPASGVRVSAWTDTELREKAAFPPMNADAGAASASSVSAALRKSIVEVVV
jgi:hypothetical protein